MELARSNAPDNSGKGPSFVRMATVADAVKIGRLSAQVMHQTIVAALAAPLSPASQELFSEQRFIAAWTQTLTDLPGSDYRVLLAITDGEICGLAALAPTTPLDFPVDHPAAVNLPANRCAFEITNFDFDSHYFGQGNEARMLAAISEITGKPGTELYLWLFANSAELIHCLTQAGFAPLGYQRELEIDGRRCAQHLWWTTF
ncbi:hypothetical protein [Arcanobacterium hippocoleae]|uniref:hypothetical protein n=1 Tax=Arcanobacterium hippocoleae TaxID=149017 RepID=UPI0033416E35